MPKRTFDESMGSASTTTTTTVRKERTVREGAISRIVLKDFMNHASVDLKLDPGVNLVTGRNGAGKSSILQAAVLGLG